MCCHFLLQGICLTQGSNLGLLHCRQIPYHLSHQASLSMFSLLYIVLQWSLRFSSVLISSVAQSGLTLCDPMDCSTPGFPVHHQLPGLDVHQVDNAIQASHPLSSPSPPAPNPSQHQGLFNESTLHMRLPKYWSFSFSISPSSEHPGLISYTMIVTPKDWVRIWVLWGWVTTK